MSEVRYVEVEAEDNDIRLDRWFKRKFPDISHVMLEKMLRKGQVRVDKKRVKSSIRVSTGQIVRVPPYNPRNSHKSDKPRKSYNIEQAKRLRMSVIFKNDDIIAINKPSGIAVQGGQGIAISIDDMLDSLQFDRPERPKLVHRLDKNTSGVLLLARSLASAARLTDLFRNNIPKKTYLAIVIGVPDKKEGEIKNKIAKVNIGNGLDKVVVDPDGKEAITHYKVLENLKGQFSLMQLQPVTGRTHQLRVHMACLGHPILCDSKYGGKYLGDTFKIDKKMYLHARSIIIHDNNEMLNIEASLPDYFIKTLDVFGSAKKKSY